MRGPPAPPPKLKTLQEQTGKSRDRVERAEWMHSESLY